MKNVRSSFVRLRIRKLDQFRPRLNVAWRAGSAVSLEIRGLIHQMSIDNPLWGAPRIHGDGMHSAGTSDGTLVLLSKLAIRQLT